MNVLARIIGTANEFSNLSWFWYRPSTKKKDRIYRQFSSLKSIIIMNEYFFCMYSFT